MFQNPFKLLSYVVVAVIAVIVVVIVVGFVVVVVDVVTAFVVDPRILPLSFGQKSTTTPTYPQLNSKVG